MKGKEKSFESLNFDAINQSSRQPLSPRLVFVSSPLLQGSYSRFMLPQWRWESDPHSPPSVFKAERHFCRLPRHIPSPAVLSAAYREREANTARCNRRREEEGDNRDSVVLPPSAVNLQPAQMWGRGVMCASFNRAVSQVKGCRILANSFALHISADAIRKRWTVAAPKMQHS